MSDGRQRDLERNAPLESTAAVSLIVEQVRSGELSPKDLELAAACGHPVARTALGDAAPPHMEPGDPLRALVGFSREAWLVACVAVYRITYVHFPAWSPQLEAWLAGFPAHPDPVVPKEFEHLTDPSYPSRCALTTLCNQARLPWPPPGPNVVLRGQPKERCRIEAERFRVLGAVVEVHEEPDGWTLGLLDGRLKQFDVAKEVGRLMQLDPPDAEAFVGRSPWQPYWEPMQIALDNLEIEVPDHEAAAFGAIRRDLVSWALDPNRPR